MGPKMEKRFVDEVYEGNKEKYLAERKDDYCRVQLIWSIWIDNLLKDGDISLQTYNRTQF